MNENQNEESYRKRIQREYGSLSWKYTNDVVPNDIAKLRRELKQRAIPRSTRDKNIEKVITGIIFLIFLGVFIWWAMQYIFLATQPRVNLTRLPLRSSLLDSAKNLQGLQWGGSQNRRAGYAIVRLPKIKDEQKWH